MKLGVFAIVLLLGGCAASAGEDACNDFVDIMVDKLADECGYGTRSDIEASISMGLRTSGIDSCADVDKVRDADSFYNDCLPMAQAMSCEDALSTVPASCASQLLVEK